MYGGQSHTFKLTAHIKSDGEEYEYDKAVFFDISIVKDCSAVTFMSATYDHSIVPAGEYNITEPEYQQEVQQFLTSDQWCIIEVEMQVEKLNEATGLYEILPTHPYIWLTLATQPRLDTDANNPHVVSANET